MVSRRKILALTIAHGGSKVALKHGGGGGGGGKFTSLSS